MTKFQNRVLILVSVLAITFGVVPKVSAMHIMEGFLPAAYCISWGILCLPFLAHGFFSLKKVLTKHRKTLIIYAMAGAFAFVLSSLKIPSLTGSSSHPTGTGLGAILFGPSAMSIIGVIVLLFQAILLAHGGLTTLGANTFSMAIAGPLLSFGVYKLCQRLHVKKTFSVFMACALGNLFTYCVTSFQLALAYPSETGGSLVSLLKFLGVFAVTQIPLALIEGIISAVVIMELETYAKTELNELGYFKGGSFNVRQK